MKVAYKDLSKAIESMGQDTVTITIGSGESAVDVDVKKYIPFAEFIEAVREAVDMCTDGNRVYPSMQEIAYSIVMVKHYTNINCDITLEHMSEIIYKTNIVERIEEIVGFSLHSAFNRTIYRLDSLYARENVEKLAATINGFIEKYSNVDYSDTDVTKLLEFASKVGDMNPVEIYKELSKEGIGGDAE